MCREHGGLMSPQQETEHGRCLPFGRVSACGISGRGADDGPVGVDQSERFGKGRADLQPLGAAARALPRLHRLGLESIWRGAHVERAEDPRARRALRPAQQDARAVPARDRRRRRKTHALDPRHVSCAQQDVQGTARSDDGRRRSRSAEGIQRGRARRDRTSPRESILASHFNSYLTIFRSLVDRVPLLLLVVVLGWSCVLFFGYGLLSDVDALTIVLAALGATCVASAVLLILELSDPYSGLFRMPHEGFDGLVRVLTKGAEMAADSET